MSCGRHASQRWDVVAFGASSHQMQISPTSSASASVGEMGVDGVCGANILPVVGVSQCSPGGMASLIGDLR